MNPLGQTGGHNQFEQIIIKYTHEFRIAKLYVIFSVLAQRLSAIVVEVVVLVVVGFFFLFLSLLLLLRY